MIFGSYKDYSMVPKVSFGMVGFTVISFIFTHQARGRRNDPTLAVVLNRLGRYEDPNTVLHLATLLAIYMKPEKAETATLMEAVRKASPEVINVISSGDAANQTYLPNPTLSGENSYNESGESSYDMFDIFGESSENTPEVTRGTRDTVVEITDGTRGPVVDTGGTSQSGAAVTDGTRGKKKRKKKVIVNDCTRGPVVTRSLFRRTTRSMTTTKGNQ